MLELLGGLALGAIVAVEICRRYYADCQAKSWDIGFHEGAYHATNEAKSSYMQRLWEVEALERMLR